MSEPVRILIVEDWPPDADLAMYEIRKTIPDCEFQRTDTESDYIELLETFKPDLILSDYHLPKFTGMQALKLALQHVPLTPVVIFTGSLSEDVAVECMKAGAVDYVIKENIRRLGIAINHALEKRKMMVERDRAEHQARERYKELQAFYSLAGIAEKQGITLEGIYQEFVDILPESWQYPEIACARVVMGGREFCTKNFTESEWMLAAPVRVNGLQVGKIEVGYLEERPQGSEGPFQQEERMLIDAIAERIGHITELRQAEEEIHLRGAALEAAANSIVITDRVGLIQWANPAFGILTGYEPSEAAGKNPRDLVKSGEQDQAFYKDLWETILAGKVWHGELVNRRRDSSFYSEEMTITPLRNPHGEITNFIAVKQDITARKAAEEKIRRQVNYLKALREIDRVILSNFDLRLSLNNLLSQALRLLEVDAGVILLANYPMNCLEYTVGLGFLTQVMETARFKLGEGRAGNVVILRHMVRIPSLAEESADPLLEVLLKQEKFVSYVGVPLIVKGKVIGVLELFHRSSLEYDQEWLDFLNSLAGQAGIAIDNSRLFEGLQRSNMDLSVAYDSTIEGWSQVMDLRYKETEGHTQRVTDLTQKVAERMGCNPQELVHIRRGAVLHDIGRMGVPESILLKPGKLTEEEWKIVRQHPTFAFQMLSSINYLSPALDIPYCHHEKWDGTGYPRGLKNGHIPLAARIFTVVDVWDALTSSRPYREAWTKSKALEYIREQSGKQFDPQVVETFLALLTSAQQQL